MIPDSMPKYNDLIDIIVESAKISREKEEIDGTKSMETVIDSEIVWWKTGSINSNVFARFAYELKEWERMSVEAFANMHKERAKMYAEQIISIGTSYRRSVDAKSSENMRDKHNSQSTLIDKINRNKIEKVYTAKGEMKKSVLDGILGREAEREDS